MTQLRDVIEIIPRKLLSDERGWFLKAITGKESNLPSYTGEVYLTMGRPGQSKGGHYHEQASEWFTLIEGEATLLLEDVVTKERIEIQMSLEKAVTVYVPKKVAHVVVNNSDRNFILLAYTDMLYSPKDTIAYNFFV